MDIRYSRGLDQMYLNQWMKNSKMRGLFPCQSEQEMANFSRSWMYYAAQKAGLSIINQDRNVGMAVFVLMPYQKVKHHALLQLVIDPESQKKGFGSSLLKNMCHLGKEYLGLEVIFMEFIGPDRYLQFFLKRGFKEYARQKGYVQGPYSDKILLECVL
jgi:ribosomal protein S18 acetylase RimI-like enzyme